MSPPPPWPLLQIAVEAWSAADGLRLAGALAEMTAADAALRVSSDPESGQTLLAGVDEDHLDRTLGVLMEGRGIHLNVGAPQVAYREALGRGAEVEVVHQRLAEREFARVKLAFALGTAGSGFQFVFRARRSLTDAAASAVQRGLEMARLRGPVAGFPLDDFVAVLLDGAYHDADSPPHAFEAAAQKAFRELGARAAPYLTEPVMRLEVESPDDCLAALIADLSSRRGEITGQDGQDSVTRLTVLAPLSNLFGYTAVVDSLSGSRGRFSMAYDHYARVPQASDDPDPDFGPAIGMRLRA